MENSNNFMLELHSQLGRMFFEYIEKLHTTAHRLGVYSISRPHTYLLVRIGNQTKSINQCIEDRDFFGRNLSYAIDVLTKKGYLICRQDTTDRRHTLIKASPKGIKLCEEIKAHTSPFKDPVPDLLKIIEELKENCSKQIKGENR